ncbi:tyrosine-type recombinase/integrase [Burkholderia cenocepacia]|uniref:site-specific integrase n=1 Tax=Burkholderia cepacia complex TaxID=87882 RepID=UPI001B9326BC|nr:MULTISPECIES: site-specific integrase [Burkholderia cepacia complex]ELW9448955.1 tyrosine-type recombinase/integrase [Burkholderia cenocepacia]MBR8483938.1 tyrosine-type recombinase/integrase [Burkholderia cenocepacia]MDN7471719.1 site-specific integrase [Burkholderia orbicola]MDN7504652.1 site-specific integrase [Burkholderia orbicola]
MSDKDLRGVVAGVTYTEGDTMTNHLLRRGSRYYVRRKVPADLVEHLGKREIVRALGTPDPTEARRIVREASVQIDREFDAARAALLGTPPRKATPHPQYVTITRQQADEAELVMHEAADEFAQPLEEQYEEHDRQVAREARRREMHERQVAAYTEALRRVGAVPGTLPALPHTPAPAAAPGASALSLAALVERWAKERQPTGGTVEQMNLVVGRFYEHVGRIPLPSVTRQHAVSFKEKLLESGLATSSVNRYVGQFFTLMNYAADSMLIPAPIPRVTVVVKRTDKSRVSFNESAVKAIFSSPVYTEGARPVRGAGEAAYWVPLLGLYTGARIEELCQLAPTDIFEESGHWCIRFVNDESEGQRVKNVGSVRRIPLHAELIRLGFLEYVASRRDQDRLFDLARDRHGRVSPTWGKWFGDYLRNVCRVTDRRMTFHSFRHLFKDICRAHGISREVADALQGHSDGSASSGYGGEFYPLRPLVEAISKFDVPGMQECNLSRNS